MTERFLLDTSCMIAVVCSWHEFHDRATQELSRRLDAGDALIVAGPTLVEAYAVLTASHRRLGSRPLTH